MKTLLEKTRRINRLLQKSAGTQVNFNELAGVLADLIGADVYVASRKGKILGLGLTTGDAEQYQNITFTEEYNSALMKVDETTANAEQGEPHRPAGGREVRMRGGLVTIVPVNGGGERLGTLVLVNEQASPMRT